MSFEQERVLEGTYVMPTYGRMPVEFTSGSGMTLVDSEGRSYLDFLGGIGVCALGHANPVLTQAISEQAQKLLTVSNYFYAEHRGEVAALLSKLANDDLAGARAIVDAVDAGDSEVLAAATALAEGEQVWQTFFANSGAEANEGSMKLARLWSKRAGSGGNTIVALRGSFHGRTLETLAATMQNRLQDEFQPLPGGFIACDPNDCDQLRRIFEARGADICAVLYEPIQGESGVHPLTQEFMETMRDLAHANDALLIADEVQTGVFRSGKPFAFQTYGVEPDIMSLAKGLGGGIPVGACVAKQEIADVFRPGDHGSTFGGSCLVVAAAEAALCELVSGGYAERAQQVGGYFMQRLAEIPQVVDVRGSGLMVGCDLADEAGDAHDVVSRMLEAGYVINATGDHTLRFLPPLIAEPTHVDHMIQTLVEILAG